jgi:thiol-disulfide isomerase/thioredoxin
MLKVSTIVAATLLAVACSRKEPAVENKPAASAPVEAAQAPEVAPQDHHGIPWYEDAPEAALAAAEQRGLPVLVDLWAPWCHTCLSMKAYVLTDANLPGVKEQFVFLAVNTEKASNAAFLQKIPVEVWPTFYVLDPRGPEIRGRWLGAASPAQFMRFLADGKHALDAQRQGGLPASDPLALLARGDTLASEKKYTEAAAAYAEALSKAPADWPRRPDTLVAQASALHRAKDFAACAELALASMEQTGTAVSASDFAYYGATCADGLDGKDRRQKQLRQVTEKRLAPFCETERGELTPDDRGDACSTLAGLRTSLGDHAGAKKATERALTIYEQASAGVPDEVALTYDWARAYALLSLGRGGEAEAFLAAREHALPDNYNPPHYLARLYKEEKRWAEGLAAIERALARAYGPRKAGFLGLKADLLLGAGKKDEARAVVEAQLAAYAALPEGQKQPAREKAVAERLNAW